MSYVRWSEDSDLYIYDDVYGGITCCSCDLAPDGINWTVPTRAEMIRHVRQHIKDGHSVPDYVIPKLEAGDG